ncbi:hypothetical protein AX15_004010 [Amanita polypyramis BW_CC]|nr:hypothetical protein AX15_004010 [Amanita polypyramis BW_CC]
MRINLVLKPSAEIEDELKTLEEKTSPSSTDKSRLTELKAELEKINKKKEDYVAEHPEKRSLVYRKRKTEEEKAQDKTIPAQRNLFNKKGLPRRPERSIYYDPVMNPYGVPPPGMPYMERPLLPGEADSENEDDVNMPEGLPPGPNDELVESDDDIPMPEGAPTGQGTLPPLSLSPSQPFQQQAVVQASAIPLPTPPVPNVVPFTPSPALPLPSTVGPPGTLPPPPPPPPGFAGAAYPHVFPNFPPTGVPAPPHGFFHHRNQSSSSMQDPLSSIPHTTYRAHQAHRTSLPLHPSLPEKPVVAAATVSAEPQLRDLKKEATAFVPTALKRKRPAAPAAPSTKVDAAPALSSTGEQEDKRSNFARPDLVRTLKDQFGPPPVVKSDTNASAGTTDRKKYDYDNFLDEMSDILGTGST